MTALGSPGRRDQTQRRRKADEDVQAARPATDRPLRRAQVCRMWWIVCGPMFGDGRYNFRLARTPRSAQSSTSGCVIGSRAVRLKQRKRGTTMYRELLALGRQPDVARQVGGEQPSRWRNSGMLLDAVLALDCVGPAGIAPALMTSDFSNRPVPDPHAGWCGRERPARSPPTPIDTVAVRESAPANGWPRCGTPLFGAVVGVGALPAS